MKFIPLACAVVTLALQDATKAADCADYFPLKVGNRWDFVGKKFSGTDVRMRWEITKTEKVKQVDCFVLEKTEQFPTGPKGELEDEVTTYYLRVVDEGIRIEAAKPIHISEENRFFLKFPLEKGKKVYGSAVVEEKPSEISVPAGKLKCLTLQGEKTKFPGMTSQSRYWISKGVGFVRFETVWVEEGGKSETDFLELKTFTQGK